MDVLGESEDTRLVKINPLNNGTKQTPNEVDTPLKKKKKTSDKQMAHLEKSRKKYKTKTILKKQIMPHVEKVITEALTPMIMEDPYGDLTMVFKQIDRMLTMPATDETQILLKDDSGVERQSVEDPDDLANIRGLQMMIGELNENVMSLRNVNTQQGIVFSDYN